MITPRHQDTHLWIRQTFQAVSQLVLWLLFVAVVFIFFDPLASALGTVGWYLFVLTVALALICLYMDPGPGEGLLYPLANHRGSGSRFCFGWLLFQDAGRLREAFPRETPAEVTVRVREGQKFGIRRSLLRGMHVWRRPTGVRWRHRRD